MPYGAFVPSLVGYGLGYYHFNKMLQPVNKDQLSPCEFPAEVGFVEEDFNLNLYSIFFQMCRPTSAGFSYLLKTKKQNINAMVNYLSLIGPNTFTIIKMAEKSELLYRPKLEVKNKVRLFASVDMHVECFHHICFDKAINFHLKGINRAVKVGMSIFHLGLNNIFKFVKNKKMIGADASDFDSSESVYLLMDALRDFLMEAHYSTVTVNVLVIYLYYFLIQPRLYDNIVFSVRGSLPSGFLLTALLNSWVIKKVLLRAGFSQEQILQNTAIYGDDLYINERMYPVFLKYANLSGLNFSINSSPTFLSFEVVYTKFGPIAKYKEIGKCFSRMAYSTFNNFQPIFESTMLSLYVIYFYHFYFHNEAKHYSQVFFSYYKYVIPDSDIGILERYFFRMAMKVWFTYIID